MADLKQMAAMTALNNMMQKDSFSICTIDNVGKVLGVNPKGESYDILYTLHCVNFSKMQPELRDAIPDLIQQCLGVAPVYQFTNLAQQITDVMPTEEKKGGLFKLLGGGK